MKVGFRLHSSAGSFSKVVVKDGLYHCPLFVVDSSANFFNSLGLSGCGSRRFRSFNHSGLRHLLPGAVRRLSTGLLVTRTKSSLLMLSSTVSSI